MIRVLICDDRAVLDIVDDRRDTDRGHGCATIRPQLGGALNRKSAPGQGGGHGEHARPGERDGRATDIHRIDRVDLTDRGPGLAAIRAWAWRRDRPRHPSWAAAMIRALIHDNQAVLDIPDDKRDRAIGTDRRHDLGATRARMAQLGGTLTANSPPGQGSRHGEHSKRSDHGRPATAIDRADRADRSGGLAATGSRRRPRTAQLGGALTVESAPGRGSVISVAVPWESPS